MCKKFARNVKWAFHGREANKAASNFVRPDFDHSNDAAFIFNAKAVPSLAAIRHKAGDLYFGSSFHGRTNIAFRYILRRCITFPSLLSLPKLVLPSMAVNMWVLRCPSKMPVCSLLPSPLKS